MKHSSFNATISALNAETSAFGAATSAIARRLFDATMSALDAETSALGVVTSALGASTARSYRRYRRGVSGDIGVGITPQMCNGVTNHGDMSTFSKPTAESSLHSRRSFSWGHFRGNIDNAFCVIADSCGVVVIPEVIGGARSPIRQCRSLRDSLNIIKHCQT